MPIGKKEVKKNMNCGLAFNEKPGWGRKKKKKKEKKKEKRKKKKKKEKKNSTYKWIAKAIHNSKICLVIPYITSGIRQEMWIALVVI